MSKSNCEWKIRAEIATDVGAGRRVLDDVLEQLRQRQWDSQDIFAVHVAMEEALLNAIKHGNQLDANKCIRIEARIAESTVFIEIADEGPGFCPDEIPDCTSPDRLEVPSGRGVMLMKRFMSRVQFNQQGNCVAMEKCRCNRENQADTPRAAEQNSGRDNTNHRAAD